MPHNGRHSRPTADRKSASGCRSAPATSVSIRRSIPPHGREIQAGCRLRSWPAYRNPGFSPAIKQSAWMHPRKMPTMIPNRIVLDTNICLDLFVFRAPRWSSLLEALNSGAVEAVTRRECRNEWLYVLNYPHLPRDCRSKSTAEAEFDALIRCSEPEAATPAARLPVCRDEDDQKFLELARDANAQVLITMVLVLLLLVCFLVFVGLFSFLLSVVF